LNVLVAEDHPINQKVISALLGRFGWTVTMAGNGKEAWQMFVAARFDLVLMDVQMPEIDGLEATRLIRASERSGQQSSRTPIVALTAHASTNQHQECIAAGMDGVVTKPVDPAALLNVIASALVSCPA
jgi:CheY-like chemotaxis protein